MSNYEIGVFFTDKYQLYYSAIAILKFYSYENSIDVAYAKG